MPLPIYYKLNLANSDIVILGKRNINISCENFCSHLESNFQLASHCANHYSIRGSGKFQHYILCELKQRKGVHQLKNFT